MHTMKIQLKDLTEITVSCDLSSLQGMYILSYKADRVRSQMMLQDRLKIANIHDAADIVEKHTRPPNISQSLFTTN